MLLHIIEIKRSVLSASMYCGKILNYSCKHDLLVPYRFSTILQYKLNCILYYVWSFARARMYSTALLYKFYISTEWAWLSTDYVN